MSWKEDLRALPAPEPPDELLSRILASRAAGVRVVLLGERPTVSRRVALLLIAAAAAVVLMMSTRGGGPRPVDRNNGYQDISATLPFWPPDAMAQEARPAHPPMSTASSMRNAVTGRFMRSRYWAVLRAPTGPLTCAIESTEKSWPQRCHRRHHPQGSCRARR